jgi:hypothetical protein
LKKGKKMRVTGEDLYGGLRLASAASGQGPKQAPKAAAKPVPAPSLTKADLAAAESRAWAKGYAAATQRAATIMASPTGRRNVDKVVKLLAEPKLLRLDAASSVRLIGQAAEADEARHTAKVKAGWSRAVATINPWNSLGAKS